MVVFSYLCLLNNSLIQPLQTKQNLCAAVSWKPCFAADSYLTVRLDALAGFTVQLNQWFKVLQYVTPDNAFIHDTMPFRLVKCSFNEMLMNY